MKTVLTNMKQNMWDRWECPHIIIALQWWDCVLQKILCNSGSCSLSLHIQYIINLHDPIHSSFSQSVFLLVFLHWYLQCFSSDVMKSTKCSTQVFFTGCAVWLQSASSHPWCIELSQTLVYKLKVNLSRSPSQAHTVFAGWSTSAAECVELRFAESLLLQQPGRRRTKRTGGQTAVKLLRQGQFIKQRN